MEIDLYMRKEAERIIKEYKLDRSKVFEVSKTKYAAILKTMQDTFVQYGGDMYWSNMGHYNPALACKWIEIADNPLWYHELPRMVPVPTEAVYVLLEDVKGYQAKYWLYEMHLPELIRILDEVNGLDDFYIISKKYRWLLSENHEGILSYVGEGLDLQALLPSNSAKEER